MISLKNIYLKGGETVIEEVILRGFQSHINTSFNLQNGLNVITGPSDSGKTAIIRAIRWVAFNEPQGEAFVNENVGEAEVTILLTNGSIITKRRRKGKTSYVVQESKNGVESVFEKSEVPLEVTQLLGIEKQTFGDFEAALNFSFQLDPPFLISETASAGAKILGKLAGTESVDLAIKGVSKDTHATRNMRSQAEKDIERINGSLLDYLGIDDAKQSLETAEMLIEQVETSHTKFETLKEYRHLLLSRRVSLTEQLEKLDKLQHVPQLMRETAEIEKSQQRYDSLLQLYSDGNRLEERISKLGQELITYEEVGVANDLTNSIEKDADRLANNTILRQSYQKYTQDVKIAQETLNKTQELIPALKVLDSIDFDIKAIDLLRNLRDEYRNTSSTLNALNTKLDTFKDMHMFERSLTAVENAEKHSVDLKHLQKEHLISEQTIKNITERYEQANRMELISQQELQEAWDDAGGVCPLCEQAHEGGTC